MAEPPDLQELAQRYLDLWQDQLRAMAADPETMASFSRMLSAMTGQAGEAPNAGGAAPDGAANPFAWWPMAGAMPNLSPPNLSPMGGATPFDFLFAAGRDAAQARAEAAAAAPDGGGDALRELERRLAALEARLDALEPGSGKGSRGGKGKSRKGKR